MYLTSNASLYMGCVSLLLVSLVMVLLCSYIAIYPLAGMKKFPDILLVKMSILHSQYSNLR